MDKWDTMGWNLKIKIILVTVSLNGMCCSSLGRVWESQAASHHQSVLNFQQSDRIMKLAAHNFRVGYFLNDQFLPKIYLFMCVSVCLSIHMCTTCVPSASRDPKTASHLLELVLRIVSCHLCSGNLTVFSTTAASALNCEAGSLALQTHFYNDPLSP